MIMKTIEERAKLASEGYDDDGYSAGLYMGYVVGATEQKAIDDAECANQVLMGKGDAVNHYKQGFHDAIDKACEWLDNYLMEIGYPDDWLRDSLNIKSGKERFRKAMEEIDK